MKSMTTLCFASILLGACSSGGAGDREAAPSAALPARASALAPAAEEGRADLARRTLASVRDVVAGGRAAGLGFASPAELDAATIGDAVPVYVTSGSSIRGRVAGADPHAVLGEPTEMMYPILVDGSVRSSVVLGRSATGGWQVTSVGRAGLAKSIDATRKSLASRAGDHPVGLVVAHDLGLELVAQDEGGRVTLTSIREVPAAGWHAGETVAAETGFARLDEYSRLRVRAER
jgi:hypothetical protein